MLDALEDLKSSGSPKVDRLHGAGSKFSPGVFRNTRNKLQVTLGVVEAMMHSVRKDRSLMDAVVRDPKAASLSCKRKEATSPFVQWLMITSAPLPSSLCALTQDPVTQSADGANACQLCTQYQRYIQHVLLAK